MTSTPEFWARISPTGCVTGSVRTEYVGLLQDDAHKEFTPRIADRRREAAEGYRLELMNREQWDRDAKPCLTGQCTHEAAGGQR